MKNLTVWIMPFESMLDIVISHSVSLLLKIWMLLGPVADYGGGGVLTGLKPGAPTI